MARIAVLVCGSLVTLAPLAARAEIEPASELYDLAPGRPVAVSGVPGVVSRHEIHLRQLADLYNLLDNGMQLPVLSLPLTHDVSAQVVFDSQHKAGRIGHLASGRVTGPDAGHVVFLFTPTALDARFTVGRAHYQIRSIGEQHFLLSVNPEALPPEAPPKVPMSGPQTLDEVPDHSHDPVDCDPDIDPKTINLLVLYTEAARAGALAADQEIAKLPDGSIDPDLAIVKHVALALEQANLALANSDATTRLNTAIDARKLNTPYFETGDGDRALAELYDAGHPLHLAVSQQRAYSAANLVALIIEHWEYCGGAPVMIDWNMHPDQTAFSVVRRACLGVDDNSLAHELGHSMGSAHDRDSARVPGLFSYSYGFNEPDGRFSTIMAYPCDGCRRIPYYSNPGKTVEVNGQGYTTGCRESPPDPECRPTNNSLSLDRAACQVAGWH